MTTWGLWRQPSWLIAWVTILEAGAVTLTVVSGDRTKATTHAFCVLLALTVAGLVQHAIGRRAEGLRRRFTDTPHVNLTSVWTFAGALILPASLNVVLVLVLYLQMHVQGRHSPRTQLWRIAMNAAIVVVTCDSARGAALALGLDGPRELIAHPDTGLSALIGAGLTYLVVNIVLIIPPTWARTGSLSAVLGTPQDNLLEVSTLCLAASATAGISDMPLLALALVPPVAVLHRGLLGRGTEDAARYDSKTGLLSAASWQWAADRALKGSTATGTSLFMIDLDLFKSVNDRYGHLVGDRVLLAVAECVQDQVRRHDVVGRFGGEEFVVLLPQTNEPEAEEIAERIRHAVTQLELRVDDDSMSQCVSGLTVSVGIAHHPHHGTTVEAVLKSADDALYWAKTNGRNQVACANT